MNDLVQSQIQESCKLALPNGLKELMWDITREVLRAQPPDLCGFISEYLLALLVTRENAEVAHHICGDVCNEICHIPLDEALRSIGFTDEDADAAKQIADKMFKMEEVKECDILTKIIKLESMTEDKLEAVKDAVCRAFLSHKHPYLCRSSSDISDLDSVDQAVHHTLRLYRCSKPSDEEYDKAATNIQAAYRAYGVRRNLEHSSAKNNDKGTRSDKIYYYEEDDLFSDTDPHGKVYTVMSDEYLKSIRFHHEDPCDPNPKDVFKPVVKAEKPEDSKGRAIFKKSSSVISSISLAGSFVNLPKFTPYTAISETSEPESTGDDGQGDKTKHHENKDFKLSEKEINISDYNEVDDAAEKAPEDSAAQKEVIEVYAKRFSTVKVSPKPSHILDTIRSSGTLDEKDRPKSSTERVSSLRGSVSCMADNAENGSNAAVRGSVPSIKENVVKDLSVRGSAGSEKASVLRGISMKGSIRGSIMKDPSSRGSVAKEAPTKTILIKGSSPRISFIDDEVRKSVTSTSAIDSSVNVIRGSIARHNSFEGLQVNDQDFANDIAGINKVWEESVTKRISIQEHTVENDAVIENNNTNDAKEMVGDKANSQKTSVNEPIPKIIISKVDEKGPVVNEISVSDNAVIENTEDDDFYTDTNVACLLRSAKKRSCSIRSSIVKNIVTENNIVKNIEYHAEDLAFDGSVVKDENLRPLTLDDMIESDED